jgi:hypothetical protein
MIFLGYFCCSVKIKQRITVLTCSTDGIAVHVPTNVFPVYDFYDVAENVWCAVLSGHTV